MSDPTPQQQPMTADEVLARAMVRKEQETNQRKREEEWQAKATELETILKPLRRAIIQIPTDEYEAAVWSAALTLGKWLREKNLRDILDELQPQQQENAFLQDSYAIALAVYKAAVAQQPCPTQFRVLLHIDDGYANAIAYNLRQTIPDEIYSAWLRRDPHPEWGKTPDATAAIAAMPPTPKVKTPKLSAYRFERIGNIWHIQFGDASIPMSDRVGYGIVRQLLVQPNKAISAIVLAGQKPEKIELATSFHEVIDKEGIEKLKERAREIAGEITEAKNAGNQREQERLQSELEKITEALKEAGFADGRQSRHRRRIDRHPGHRFADNVRQNIKNITDELKESLPALAEHIEKYIDRHEGHFTYRPPDPAPIWRC